MIRPDRLPRRADRVRVTDVADVRVRRHAVVNRAIGAAAETVQVRPTRATVQPSAPKRFAMA